jgi:hypothetical protein
MTRMTSAGEVERVVIDIVEAHWFQSRTLNCYSEVVKPYGLVHLVLLMAREKVHLAGNYRKVCRNTDVLGSEDERNQKSTVV